MDTSFFFKTNNVSSLTALHLCYLGVLTKVQNNLVTRRIVVFQICVTNGEFAECPLLDKLYSHVAVKSLIKKGAVDGPFSILAKGLMVNDG